MDNVQKHNICTYYLILKISICNIYYVFKFRTHCWAYCIEPE
jgi:hypothetical protein